MNSWMEFAVEEPELAKIGKNLLFPDNTHVGLAFLATIRKDGAPRLHPVSLVFWDGHLYVLIPPTSPKCADLRRDGRLALQAFPPQKDEDSGEFYIAGYAKYIKDLAIRMTLISGAELFVEENEKLFELLIGRVMYTRLVNRNTPTEHPMHTKWRSRDNSN